MSSIITNAFNEIESEQETDESASQRGLTKVTTPVDELPYIQQAESIPPLSRLKQQRLKEKQKKEQRKMKKIVDKRREHNHRQQGDVAPFKEKGAKWEEVKTLAMQVYDNIGSYVNICSAATGLITRDDLIIDNDTINYVNHRVNVISGDIQNFRDKWQNLSVPAQGKEGPVSENDYPTFYLAYNEFITLQQDVNNVLSEQAAELSEVINMIVIKATELLKSQEQTQSTSQTTGPSEGIDNPTLDHDNDQPDSNNV